MTDCKWDFSGKVALVTGGSRGIGRACVQQLARAGAEVIFTYASHEQAAYELVEECYRNGSAKITAIRANFREQADRERLAERIAQQSHLHFLIHNAGLLSDAPLYKMTDTQWEEVLQVNLDSFFGIAKAAIRPLSRSQGSIVSVASVAGMAGGIGQVNYSAAKAGMIGFTKALAREVGGLGIRVNAVAPGYVETEMVSAIPEEKKKKRYAANALKRIGQADEIAAAILFLLSEQASFITAQVLVADGGLL
ncbi:3-oxoacyl-ACP reductase family protein [Brevibacillus fulvus]|uniref:NAD(P)-dependent dehydrogenase (Short-subunit alcohol dehydrogenase family) n=1 Tax=Brevibacillus fulvus TaxID=1125967 RepID=A0A938XXY6_9BACL|nr:3-oxoacyl-ACP reductase family protein [Brevibacillus fulvus]MBM7589693.1 NAD(P)-dependent dehydrogenase (short-subunit alcohol dehydrogenase family) [Brevibacillus fulvus]